MTVALVESEDRIEFTGVVTPPPTLDAILAKLEAGATGKQPVLLTPGEVRVLHNFVEAF